MHERQTSFASGELAPGMYGRTDLQQFAAGARTLFNFFVSPHGNLVSRPGLQMAYDGWPNTKIRIIPFVFSDSQACLIAISPGAMRVIRYDSTTGVFGTVLNDGTVDPMPANGAAFNIYSGNNFAEKYTESQLPDLRFSQMGDVLVIVHPDVVPQELRRTSSSWTSWSIVEVSTSVPGFPSGDGFACINPAMVIPDDDNPAYLWSYQITRIRRDSDGRLYETQPLAIGSRVEYQYFEWYDPTHHYGGAGDPMLWVIIPETEHWYKSTGQPNGPDAPQYPLDNPTYWTETDTWDSAFPPIQYAAAPNELVISAENPIVVDWRDWPTRTFQTPAGTDQIVATRVYRGREGIFGFLAETTGGFYLDEGGTPDWTIQPPKGTNPFEDGYPSLVTFYGARRIFAAPKASPGKLWMSAVDQFCNFDELLAPKDTDSLSHELLSSRQEAVRALVPRRGLLALTESGEWLIDGGGSPVVTPASICATPLSEYGAADVSPVSFGSCIFFLQRKGTVPRAIIYSEEGGGYTVLDMSTLSKHLFVGHTIVEMCYAEDPWSTLWCVRDDGILLSCAFVRDHNLVAWARHEIAGGGLAEGIASIPEGSEDAVYVVVNRDGRRSVERFATRVIEDIEDAVAVDCATQHDGTLNTNTNYKLTILSVTAPTVAILLSHAGLVAVGDYVKIWSGDDSTIVHILVVVGTAVSGETVEEVPTALVGVALSTWGKAKTTCSDLPAVLEGESVYALLDGNVAGPFTVSGRAIQCPDTPYMQAIVGLAYNCDFESIDVAQDHQRQKIVKKVVLEFEGTRAGYAGRDLTDLHEARLRKVEHNYAAAPLQRTEAEVIPTGRWEKSGQVAVRNSDPVPMTILGITRELEFGA